jgi:hypothetical protein
VSLPWDVAELPRGGRWRALTAVPDKMALFAAESYLRESWAVAVDVLGRDTLELLQRVAVLTLKPDAVIGRKGPACLAYLRRNGFRPLLARRFRYDHATLREIWRYQWNIATLDRLAVGDALYMSSESLAVVLVDERPGPMPASVRLTGLKGSSLPGDRNPDELRSVLGGLNRMVVLVHCSDEPIDILRELGILFTGPELRRLLGDLRATVDGSDRGAVTTELAEVHRGTPEFAVSLPSALAEVEQALTAAAGRGAAAAAPARRALAALRRARTGTPLSWPRWRADLDGAGVPASSWPVLLVASHYIQHDLPGVRCVIAESGRERWLRGEGQMLLTRRDGGRQLA